MSTDRKMEKQNVEYADNKILFSLKKEWNFYTCNNMNESCKPYATYSKPNTEGQISILYESTYKVPRRGKSIETDWGQEKGTTEDEMIGWHHQLAGHESDQTRGDGEGQGSLLCCSQWDRKELDTTEPQNKNDTNIC